MRLHMARMNRAARRSRRGAPEEDEQIFQVRSPGDPWCLDLAREAFAEWDAERKGEKLTVGAKTHPLESAALGILANPGMVLGTWKGNFDADGHAIPGGAFIGVGALSVSVPGWLVFNEAESAFRERAVRQ